MAKAAGFFVLFFLTIFQRKNAKIQKSAKITGKVLFSNKISRNFTYNITENIPAASFFLLKQPFSLSNPGFFAIYLAFGISKSDLLLNISTDNIMFYGKVPTKRGLFPVKNTDFLNLSPESGEIELQSYLRPF